MMDLSDFPLKSKYRSADVLMDRMNNLAEYEPRFVNEPYTIRNMPFLKSHQLTFIDEGTGAFFPTVLLHYEDDYERYSAIADFFTEYARIKARRNDKKLTPLEFWKKHKSFVLSKAREEAKRVGKLVDTYIVSETLHQILKDPKSEAAEVTSFRPTNMVAMCKLFSPKRVLDFSSGWGDRLVAATALNLELYVGVDPNRELRTGYEEIIDFFHNDVDSVVSNDEYTSYTFENGHVVKMITSPFEELDLKEKEFDMVFTSPPYFDLEKYSSKEDQSVEKFKTLDSWYDGFLMPSIKKAWEALALGGVMVLVINDRPFSKENERSAKGGPRFERLCRSQYIEKMISDVNMFPTSRYLGCIAYAYKEEGKTLNPQPMWIWRKVKVPAPITVDGEVVDSLTLGGKITTKFSVSPSPLLNLVVVNKREFYIAVVAKKHGYRVILLTDRVTPGMGKFMSLGVHVMVVDDIKAKKLQLLIS